MQIEIKDDDGNIVIVNDQCYVYAQQGDTDTFIEWADLTPAQVDYAVELVGVSAPLNFDLLF